MSDVPLCTAIVLSGSPLHGARRVCNRPIFTYDSAGHPRCGLHSRGARKAAAAGEFQVEPELEECRLRCSCGIESTMALPGDAPLRQVLAQISCPCCGRKGALALRRNESKASAAP